MSVELRMTASQRTRLLRHLFCGDGAEHGAVLACGIARSTRGIRLLVREVFLAQDGADFIPSANAHRALSAAFVAKTSDYCHDHGFAWLSVHNHGPGDAVGFSSPDRQSHARLYPSLEHYTGQPVGAVVFADRAIAGEIRFGGIAHTLRRATIVGDRIEHLYPKPPPKPDAVAACFDRQALFFGAVGQLLLREMKIVVVGAGGAGSIVALQLARLGIGELVVIDPDRVSISNLSRIPGSSRLDALAWFAESRSPALRRFASRFARPKVRVIAREARRANSGGLYRGIFADVMGQDVADELTNADFIFCATDTMTSRMMINGIAHQYMIPAIQLGAKVPVDAEGTVGIIHLPVRPITVDGGCLDCAGVITQRLLHQESLLPDERRRHRYVDDPDVEAPSVITLNTEVAGRAVTDFLFIVCGLHDPSTRLCHQMYEPRERALMPIAFSADPGCSCCSTAEHSRFALGDARRLPTKR
jgi:molybdopterin/thiamine biosynthesis adenylyltransferase